MPSYYYYESQFMARKSKDPSNQHFVEKYNTTFRYLNDMLALNSDDFNNYTRGIYPAEVWIKQISTIKYVRFLVSI